MGERNDDMHGNSDRRAPQADAILQLIATLGSRDAVARQKARKALVVVGPPATEHLVALLDDRHAHVRWEAAKTLSEIADPRATAGLIRALEDRDAGIRWLAGEGLAHIGQEALPLLLSEIVQRPDCEWLREGVYHVLHELARKRPWATIRKPLLASLREPRLGFVTPLAAYRVLRTLAAHPTAAGTPPLTLPGTCASPLPGMSDSLSSLIESEPRP